MSCPSPTIPKRCIPYLYSTIAISMYNKNDIAFFLNCGFLPYPQNNAPAKLFHNNNLSQLKRKVPTESCTESEMIKEGINALKQSFKNIKSGRHIVPLSSGFDSRAILAELIELGLKDAITVVTYGKPGTYNYEIAKILAQHFGLDHRTFDLTKIKINSELLLETAKNGSSWTFLFDAYYNSLICKEFGKEPTYWSGFIGGGLGGSHLPPHESKSWQKAKAHFVKCNLLSNPPNLLPPDYTLEDSLPLLPFIDRSVMTYDDQLHFGLRQENYIKRVILFNGYQYRTPFLSSQWVTFNFNIPRRYRMNKYMYKKILLKAYPEMFSLPTGNNFGGSLNISRHELYFRKTLNYIHKKLATYPDCYTRNLNNLWNKLIIYDKTNYIDLNHAIRKRSDYNSIIKINLHDLKKRNIIDWLDIGFILRDHLNNNRNHSLILILLTALEISLKASE